MAEDTNSNIGLLGGLLGGFGAYQQYSGIGDIQDQYAATIGGLQSTLPEQVAFKPYTVTSGLGSSSVDQYGGQTFGLGDTTGALSSQLFGGAGNFLTQAGQVNPYLSGQAQTFSNLLGGYQGVGYNPYQLSGQYGQTVQGLSDPSQTGFQQYSLSGTYGPSQIAGLGSSLNQGFQRDSVSPYGFGNAGLGALSNQALGMGMQGLASSQQAPRDIEGLRGTTGSLSQSMFGQLGQSTSGREADIYSRIRATQTPEEERQQLALEERLAAQGRLGIQTAQFGGTPEQLALAKAREEAKNTAAMGAMEQARAEQQQQYAQASGLAGLTGQLAGTSSQLQSQAQQRAQELANMGMSSAQINSQLQSEGLGRALQAGQYNRQGFQMQSQLASEDLARRVQEGQFGMEQQRLFDQLQTSGQARDIQAGQFGMSQQQLQSQLQNEELQRRLQSGEFGREGQVLASQLATQAMQRDIAQGSFGLQQAQALQGMLSGDIQNQLALAGGTQGALQAALAQQAGLAQLGTGMLSAGYTPYDYLFKQSQLGADTSRLSQASRETQANLLAQLGLGGLAEQTKLEQIRGDILRQAMQAAGGIGTATLGSGSSIDSALGGLLSSAGGSLLEAIFGKSASTPTLGSGGPAI